jgi:drug/metabolite transporter (DMT)-like permease
VAGLERIRRRGAVGLLLGLAGVAVLVNPVSGGAPDLGAASVALGGALCWGCGSAYARRAPHPDQPLLASSMQLICAGVALCVAGAAAGELGRIQAGALASESALALAYLIVFGSLVAYSSYEWLVRHAPSQLTGTYAFVNPLVAVLLGWWLLGEHVSGRTLLAAAVIVAGVALLVMPAARRQPPPRPPGSGTGLGTAAGAEPRAGRELGAAFGAVLDGRRHPLAAAHAELGPGRVGRLARRAHRP